MSNRKSTTDARFSQFLQPILDSIQALGGSARPAEVKEWILKNLKLPEDYVNAVHKGGESKFGNDVDWARFYLVRAGYLDSSKRGVWSLTDLGRTDKIDASKATGIIRNVDKNDEDDSGTKAFPIAARTSETYVERALNTIESLPPRGFEDLC